MSHNNNNNHKISSTSTTVLTNSDNNNTSEVAKASDSSNSEGGSSLTSSKTSSSKRDLENNMNRDIKPATAPKLLHLNVTSGEQQEHQQPGQWIPCQWVHSRPRNAGAAPEAEHQQSVLPLPQAEQLLEGAAAQDGLGCSISPLAIRNGSGAS